MSDELVWRRRSPGEENWRAESAAEDATYIVYILEGFGTPTIRAVISRFGREVDSALFVSMIGAGSIDDAKEAAQAHHNAACRAKRWRDYMATHEPPTEESK